MIDQALKKAFDYYYNRLEPYQKLQAEILLTDVLNRSISDANCSTLCGSQIDVLEFIQYAKDTLQQIVIP